jgi:NAD(P)-dependent dehydrogenase (short-subunit alcohol dehydrogenase family)
MTEPCTSVITGATGTVGRCLTRHLAGSWPGRLCMAGRTRPGLMRAGDTFTECDLADPVATGRAGVHIAAASPVTGLICCAGLDSRAGLPDLDVTAFTACMQVNCLAYLQLFRALVAARPATAIVFAVVVISNDVIGRCMPATAAYAAAKAAAEEAFRHATADAPEPGIALLLVRLPDIGVPMRAAVPAPQLPARSPGQYPLPVLDAAAEAITQFVTSQERACVEVWHA